MALTAASLALGAAALHPATAVAQPDENQGFVRVNYAYCVENPSAPTCPGNYNVNRQSQSQNVPSHRAASHQRGKTAHYGY